MLRYGEVGWVDGHRAKHGRRAPPFFGRCLVVGLAALDPPYSWLKRAVTVGRN
jgi:hypothetical protein